MIVAFSGKIGSGKDTAAKLWQDISNEDRLVAKRSESIWQVHKFAESLKQIIALMLNIRREDLEKEEVKSSLLPDEWQVYSIYSWEKPMPNFIPFPTEVAAKVYCDIHNNSQHRYTYKKSSRTVRWLMIHIGTTLFRNQLHENVHINMTFAKYKLEAVGEDIQPAPFVQEPYWLITDCRFIDEAEAIKARNGIIIRLNRDGGPQLDSESETELDDYTFDYVVDNNGTLEELYFKLQEIYGTSMGYKKS